MIEVKCWHCGSVFKADRRRKYCTDKCRLKEEAERKRIRRGGMRKKASSDIRKINAEAKRLGMSYGKYVSMMESGKAGKCT